MIRITLVRKEYVGWDGRKVAANTKVKEFPDSELSRAIDWFMHDSYFDETYTTRAVWEVIKDDPDTTVDDDGLRTTIRDVSTPWGTGKEIRVRGLIKIGQVQILSQEEYASPHIRDLVVNETQEKVREKIREITKTSQE